MAITGALVHSMFNFEFLVQKLLFETACFCKSADGGIKSHSVIALVSCAYQQQGQRSVVCYKPSQFFPLFVIQIINIMPFSPSNNPHFTKWPGSYLVSTNCPGKNCLVVRK